MSAVVHGAQLLVSLPSNMLYPLRPSGPLAALEKALTGSPPDPVAARTRAADHPKPPPSPVTPRKLLRAGLVKQTRSTRVAGDRERSKDAL